MARKGYIQLVNGFYMNRKVRKLRHTCPSAIGAFTMMLTFCGDNLSDGHISEDDALYVLDITDSELEALCNVGMIEPDGNNGYYIHDYLMHNRSREQVQKKRESNAENYQKNKNEVKTSDSDAIQPSESHLNRDKHQNTRTPEHQRKRKKNILLLSPKKPQPTNTWKPAGWKPTDRSAANTRISISPTHGERSCNTITAKPAP